MQNAEVDESQAGSKIAGRNIKNLRYADDDGIKWIGIKEPLDDVKEEEWKSWLKTQHPKN